MGNLPGAILDFWFGDALCAPEAIRPRVELWFAQDAAFDRELRSRFESLPGRALAGAFDDWLGSPESALALVLVLDQFPRNLFREEAAAFSFDPKACEVASRALEAGFDARLEPLAAMFLYMPFEHSEDLAHQNRAVALFEGLLERATPALEAHCRQFADYARRHREVVLRFGRFPHRNAALGRTSSAEEIAYLESGGESFGGGR